METLKMHNTRPNVHRPFKELTGRGAYNTMDLLDSLHIPGKLIHSEPSNVKLGTYYTIYWLIFCYEANCNDKLATSHSVYALYASCRRRQQGCLVAVHEDQARDIVIS